jgi:transposase
MNTTALAAENKNLSSLVASLQEQLSGLEQENKLLRQKLEAFIRRYFGGSKSEAIDPKQLELILAGLSTALAAVPPTAAQKAAAQTSGAASAPRKPAGRQPLPEHLPTERVVLEPEPVRVQPEAFKKIGEEVTEELDWKPAQFIRRLYVRPKYVRRAGTPAPAEEPPVLIASLPSRLIEKGLPGAGLLAQVVISKYEDHLPLYRQEKIYWERHGVKLPRQTLAAWIEQGAQWLRPVYEAMKGSLVKGDYLQVDETPIRYLDPDCPGRAQIGYLWTYSRPGADVVFEWNTSRGRDGPKLFLKNFRGRLQTDGYSVYASLAGERPELILIGCWAHARRKFVEALEEDRRAAWIVRQIAILYRIEKRLREKRAGPALREAVRASDARPVLERIGRALRLIQPLVLPKSLLGEAISYTLERWTELCRYRQDGAWEIDNNLVENAIRPTAVGKKNFLFIGHPEAGWRSAVIYSVLGSCRRYGVDPHEYLRDVLGRLPAMKITEIESITPAAWAKVKKAAAKAAKRAA